MNFLDTLKSQTVRPEMPPELSWAIITLFALIIVWIATRYINRLDMMLERIDTAIEGINERLIHHDNLIEGNAKDIKDIKEAMKPRRR